MDTGFQKINILPRRYIQYMWEKVLFTAPSKYSFVRSMALCLVVGLLAGLAQAQPSEYLLKAAFLEKFARFTDWPENHFNQEDNPSFFVISIIGKSPFHGALEQIYTKAEIKGKKVKIQYIDSVDQIPGSNILFICKSEINRLNRLIQFSQKLPILIVSDTKGFAQKGSHINLYIRANGTLHFEINPEASKQAGLKIQLILLDIAKIIRN